MNATKSLKLPSSYRTISGAFGHIDKKLVEISVLHSGTPGHVTVYAAKRDGEWKEIKNQEYQLLAVQLLNNIKQP